MAEYALYGKRTQVLYDKYGKPMGPDRNFQPLTYRGQRVPKSQLKDTFATKEDAEEFLKKVKLRPGVEVEVRKL